MSGKLIIVTLIGNVLCRYDIKHYLDLDGGGCSSGQQGGAGLQYLGQSRCGLPSVARCWVFA